MVRYFCLDSEASGGLEDADWIHLEDPSIEVMTEYAERFRFPLDYLRSTVDPDEVSRAEELEQQEVLTPVLVSLLYPLEPADRRNEGVYINRTISVILLEDRVLTCCKENPEFFNDILTQEFDLLESTIHPQSLLIEIAWRISRSYVYASRDIRTRMNTIHDQLGKSTHSDLLLQMSELDKSGVYLHTAVRENHLIMKKLNQMPYMSKHPCHSDWLHDVLVENYQAEKMLDQTRQMLTHLDTTFSSVIQNNLNETMKTLTSLTIIVTIPTITAGLWGMNVGLPIEKNPFAFILIVLLTVFLMFITFLWLKHKDFL